MIVISKMKDGLYNVSNGEELKTDQTRPLAMASCFWEYGIKRMVIDQAFDTMDKYGNDMIVFFNDCEYTTKKIDYSEVYK